MSSKPSAPSAPSAPRKPRAPRAPRAPAAAATTPTASKPDATPIPAARRARGSGVFESLRDMAISYRLRPGERLSEIALAQQLGVSRTPVREALGRLVTEGFLLPASRGFMRRPLDVQESLDLYEARAAVENACLALAIERATDAQIARARAYLAGSRKVSPDASVEQLVELDEGFHLQIADMACNQELRRMLVTLNERIRFVRWIDMESVGRQATQKEHRLILEALQARDLPAARRELDGHIGRRRDQIVAAITKGLARIYLPSDVPGASRRTGTPDAADAANAAD